MFSSVFGRQKRERAISSVVTTVLIILISVIVTTSLFLGVRAIIRNVDSIDMNVDLQLVSSEGYTLWDNENRLSTVQVERGSDESDIIGFDMILDLDESSVTHYVEDIPDINSRRVYLINLSNYPGELISIRIIPVFEGGVLGKISSELNVEGIVRADVGGLIDRNEISGEFVTPTGSSGSSEGGGGSGDSSGGGICGDGNIDPGEVCDSASLSSQSCESLGYDDGVLDCLSDCSNYDNSSCVYICGSCSECDSFFDPFCTYDNCRTGCGAGCYYDGRKLFGNDCIALSSACVSVSECSDYSDEECENNPCGLSASCEFTGGNCVEESGGSGGGDSLDSNVVIEVFTGEGMAPFIVHFDAIKSYSPTGEITDYYWNFHDSNSQYSTYDNGRMVGHRFDNPGIYSVDLIVLDSASNTYRNMINITVLDKPASARIYYVANSVNGGDDSNDGLCATNQGTCGPWETFDKVKSEGTTIPDGSEILFNRGDTFSLPDDFIGAASLGSLMRSAPYYIKVGAYGSGDKPYFSGGMYTGHTAEGQGIIIEDLHLSGRFIPAPIYHSSTQPTGFRYPGHQVHVRDCVFDDGFGGWSPSGSTYENIYVDGASGSCADDLQSFTEYIYWNNITILNAPGHGAYFASWPGSNDPPNQKILIENSEFAHNGHGPNLRDGFTVHGATDNFIFRNNSVHHNGFGVGWDSAYAGDTVEFNRNFILEDSVFHSQARYTTQFSSQQNFTIRNNLFYNNSGSVINLLTPHNYDGFIDEDSFNVRIYNNVFYNNYDGYGGAIINVNQDQVDDVYVYNNIFYDNDGISYLVQDDGANDLSISNNLYYDNLVNVNEFRLNLVDSYDMTSWISSGNEPGLVNSDPLFRDVLNNDFSLTIDSPAIDSGLNVYSSRDKLGNIRPFNFIIDIGAYEYNSETQDLDNSITQYGITWEFGDTVEYGQYVNGDYWVLGPVNITRITPDFDGSHHGWMVNYDGGAQGFESRATGFDSGLVLSLPYLAQPGDSIIKSVAQEPFGDSLRPPTKTMAVLTVVSSVPQDGGATVFRPSFFGTDRTTHSIFEINPFLIPSIPAPAGYTPPTLQWVADRYKMMQLDIDSCCDSEMLRAVDNFCDGTWVHACSYGGRISIDNTDATLRLMLDDDYLDKYEAIIYYLQFGLDLYYQFKQGVSWYPNGGHGSGRKLPIIFTGIILENDEIKNAVLGVEKQVGDSSVFQEDGFLTPNQIGYAIFGSSGTYWNNIVTDYNSRTSIDPYGYIDGSHVPGTSYQTMNSMMWKGMVVAMNLVPEIKTIWDNPLFENYTVRWVEHGAWAQPDPCAPVMGYCVGGDNDGEVCTYANVSFCENSGGYCAGGRCPSGTNVGQLCFGSGNDICDDGPGDDGIRCSYSSGDFYGVTFGPDGLGDCIQDLDSSDGIGRFPAEHGLRANTGGYQSSFSNAMWDEYM